LRASSFSFISGSAPSCSVSFKFDFSFSLFPGFSSFFSEFSASSAGFIASSGFGFKSTKFKK
jgi:hypothetical protein